VRRNLIIAATSALVVLTSCGGGGHGTESLGPPPEAVPTGNAPPPVASSRAATGVTGATGAGSSGSLPTTSPGITGSVDTGNATIAVSGALQTTQTTLPLASPAIYAPPPGSFTLAWTTPTAGFALGGTSFIGTEPTSSTLRLTFFVHSASGTASFAPGDGACSVTVTTAEATAFDGTFSCVGVSDVNGTLVVSAQGTFSAAG
jgi:hypothetical protein